MGRVLQLIGGFLMAGAAALALGLSTPANAGIMASLSDAIRSVQQGMQQSTAAQRLALPNATPSPTSYAVPRGGRLTFSMIGSLSLGHTSLQSVTGLGQATPTPASSGTPSPFIGTGASSISTSESSESLGLAAEVARRTPTTSMDVRVPLAFSVGQHATLGLAQILYSTPKYALGYGSQSSSVLGQLPSGSTQRGFFGIVPIRGGDTTWFEGPSTGAQGEVIPVRGVRLRVVNGRTLYEAGLTEGDGSETGHTIAALLGSASTLDRLSIVDEVAFEDRRGGDFTGTGLSYQLRVDDGSNGNFLTAIERHVSDAYLAFGSGEIYGDNYNDVAYHRSGSSGQSFQIDSSRETVGSFTPGQLTSNDQTSLSYSNQPRFGSVALQLGSATAGSGGTTTWSGTGSIQLATNVAHGSLLLVGQAQKQTNNGGTGNLAQTGYSATFQVPLKSISLGVNAGVLTQFSSMSGLNRIVNQGLSVGRQFGKASIQIGDTFAHTESDQSQARTSNLQIALSRQISPAISVQTTYGFQRLNDPLNPASDGRSHTFSFGVNLPFSYGNGLVSGRIDPRLPATIVGRVLTDTSANPGFNSFVSSSGVSNVLVVLDNKTVQRTDVAGNFQFSFVNAGAHQVRVETGSLPRGTTVDIPVNSITVDGGQTANVTFLVGNFGGVQGHVYGRSDTGAIIPLPSVQLRIDKGAYSKTDESGAYGFGKLLPGRHTLTLIDNTIPAFASFDKSQETKTINVTNGVYTVTDFTAQPLGSIAGSIAYAPDMDKLAGQPVPNVYVVAEPGEHAAIDDPVDGTFIIDDLPPGDYTISVDSETVPQGLGAGPDSLSVSLGPQEHYQGAAFLVGHSEKKVVFSFVGGAQAAPSAPKVRLSEHRLPLRGTATVSVDAPADAGKVTIEGVGEPVDLVYDPKSSAWVGTLRVPTNVKQGSYTITARALKGTQPEAATLIVDPKMPIAILQSDNPNAVLGSYVHVRARFLVDVQAGDRIEWADGQVTTLGKPVAGRIFTFQLRVSLRPLHGLLLTKGAALPINLM